MSCENQGVSGTQMGGPDVSKAGLQPAGWTGEAGPGEAGPGQGWLPGWTIPNAGIGCLLSCRIQTKTSPASQYLQRRLV